MEPAPDQDRIERIRRVLDEAELDALVGTLPEHVLMLSGYWPVVGNAVAIATRRGQVAVVAPQDEKELAEEGWADPVLTFRPVSVETLEPLDQAVREPLAKAATTLGIARRRIGFAKGPTSQPVSYSAMNLYGAAVVGLLGQVLPAAYLEPADEWLRRLMGVKTPRELDCLRRTCRIAERAFTIGSQVLRPGLTETEAAIHFRAPLSTAGTGFEGTGRADGFAWCMSGPNAAEAQAAYARSRPKPIQRGEFVLVHCNAYADGFWTDITRTFCVDEPDRRQGQLYDAVFEARAAALGVIRPGARAADVDAAVRDVLKARGLGDHFKHPAGHGVGFAAIDHNALPRLHPKSDDVLEAGMVFNLEPAVYFDGDCGLRHCDVVAVTEAGAEVLTPFQAALDQLIIR